MAAGDPVTLWFLDVDGLKNVNDRRGHDVGDMLLLSVATALQDVFAGSAVARLSGDEFAVLQGDRSAVHIAASERRFDARLAQAATSTGLPVRVSTGTARAEPGARLSDVLSAADAAMYAAKAARNAERTLRGGLDAEVPQQRDVAPVPLTGT